MVLNSFKSISFSLVVKKTENGVIGTINLVVLGGRLGCMDGAAVTLGSSTVAMLVEVSDDV